MRICRTCRDKRVRRGQPLPPILCADCATEVKPRRGYKGVVRCDECAVKREHELRNRRARERRASDPEFARASAEASERYGRTRIGRRREYAARWRIKLGLPSLAWEQLEALLAEQGYRCRICSTSIEFNPGDGPDAPMAAHLDHDHETLVIRGWLCSPCNRGLGVFGDDVDTLLSAVAYLRERGSGVVLDPTLARRDGRTRRSRRAGSDTTVRSSPSPPLRFAATREGT
jgi:head-tail adaptor